MKAFFRKIARGKKRQAIKRAIAVGVTAYAFKYRIINQTTDLLINSNQEIQSTNNQKNYTVADDDYQSLIESKSVNSIRVKTRKRQNKTFEALKFALEVRSGDLGKSGPGPRAKADARRNFKPKASGSIIIPGADGFGIPHQVYDIYQKSGRSATSRPIMEMPDPDFNDGVPPRSAPSVSPNRQDRIKSQPLKIKSEHQKADVVITKKDIKKWITPDERKKTCNQKINEKKVEDKFVDTVKNPDEVLDGVNIHHKQRACKVYIQDVETNDGPQEKLALIADAETGRSYLGSTVTQQEYSNLKKTGEIDLSDLRRDPQTLVMNQKSIQEAEILGRAKDEGCLDEFTNVRCPYNVTESKSDYVGTDRMGSKVDIDVKSIDGSGRRPLMRQTQDINENIKDSFDGADDPIKLRIICDISPAPGFMQSTVIKNITQGFNSNQLKNINFLFD